MDKHPGLRPRNVTATDDERAALLNAAPPHLKLWMLLCADLAIRSSTAARLSRADYNADRRELRFETKCGERLTLPVTAAVEKLINECDPEDRHPFVHQLWLRNRANRGPAPHPTQDHATLRRAFKNLRLSIGITRKLTLHDLRRTTAVAMLEHSGDIRDVQALLGHRNLASTIWYLDHDLRPVKRSALETIKSPTWRMEHTA
ncbi:MAG: tyrosine-type recombinase/integrase [Terracidiphilus sp.]